MLAIMELNGTSAIVTGGASGLGEATARVLAAAGVHVVIADLNEEAGKQIATEIGGQFAKTNVTDEDAVAAAVAAAEASGRPLRVAVNCAGIGFASRTVNRDGSPHDLASFTKVIAVNLTGTFNVLRLAAAAMAKTAPADADGQRGVIINTSSVAGIEGQTGQIAYSASKGGIIGMTVPAARDLSVIGVRVNTICPGVIDTNIINTTRFDAPAGKQSDDVDGRRGQLGKMFALRHYGPDKVANAILSSVKKKKPIRPVAPEAYALYGLSRLAPQGLRNAARMRVI